MDLFTHFVFGLLMYVLILKDVTFNYIILALFASILPDLDVFLFPLKRKFKSKYLDHRGGSHSYIVGIIASLIIAFLYALLTHQSFFLSWLISSIFYSLHISMDLLTTSKIPYLYPLSKKEYCFYVEKAGSLFTMISSIVFLILLGLLVYNSSDIFLLNLYANVYTIFFIAYYIYRILSKILISLDLKKDYKYFPGILPFNYFLYKFNYSGSKISQSIERKSHFWKKRKIHSVDNILDTEEKEIFMKATEKCQQIYYYTKWTLFPIFVRNGFIFTVKFFFLETMIKNRTMYIQFDFNKLTHNLINTSRGSGIISTIS